MSLHDHGVRVFCVDVSKVNSNDENFERLLNYVDKDSRTRIRKFHRRPDAMRCLIGRLLSRAVAISVGTQWADVQLDKEKHGRPFYKSPPNLAVKVDFNIAHDSDWVVCAYVERKRGMDQNTRIGVDVMKVRLPWKGQADEFCDTIRDQLTSREYQDLKELPNDTIKTRTLMVLWTHKEAVSKAIGSGVSGGLEKWDFGENISQMSSSRRSHLINTQQDLVHQSEIFSWKMKDVDESPNSEKEWLIEWVSLCDFVTNCDHVITVALYNPSQKGSKSASSSSSSSSASSTPYLKARPKATRTSRSSWIRILTVEQLCKHAVPL